MDPNPARTKNPDAWIRGCPEFSRPICEELRDSILRWEPDLTETIKWNNLCFKGRKLVCGISGCKKHVSVFFFRGTELDDRAGIFDPAGENNTAIQTVKITDPEKLNRPALRRLIRSAVLLDEDPELPPVATRKREPWPMPDFFAQALKKNAKAAANFEKFAPTYQREYLVWLTTAKREETRAARLKQTLKALAAGLKWADRKKA